MRLRLKNNAFALGWVVPTTQPGVLAWQNQGFSEPFLFELDAIRSLARSRAASLEVVEEVPQFRIELRSGEVAMGAVEELGDHWLLVRSSILGSLRLRRDQLVSLVRAGHAGEVIYPGLTANTRWNFLSAPADWQLQAGSLTATRQGAALAGDIQLPARCEIGLSLSWKGVPDFVLSLGVEVPSKLDGVVASAARLEVWDRNMVLVRETSHQADLARLADMSDRSAQIELTVLLDQDAGLVAVRDLYGRQLGKLTVPAESPKVRGGLLLVNHGPMLTVERLEVRSWDGVTGLGGEARQQVELRDGSLLDGAIVGLNSERQTFLVATPQGDRLNVPVEQLSMAWLGGGVRSSDVAQTVEAEDSAEVELLSSGRSAPRESVRDSSSEAGGEVEVVLLDHSRWQGQWLASTDGRLRLRSPSLVDVLDFDPDHLTGLIGNQRRYSIDLTTSRNGVLKIDDTELPGALAADVAASGREALRWQPHGSLTASPLTAEASGTISYRQQLPLS